MNKQNVKENKDPGVMLSMRVHTATAKKLRVFLAKSGKKMTHWLENVVEHLPEEEEEHRRYRRKVG